MHRRNARAQRLRQQGWRQSGYEADNTVDFAAVRTADMAKKSFGLRVQAAGKNLALFAQRYRTSHIDDDFTV